MLNIALCDDRPEELAELRVLLEDYRRSRPSLELAVFCFPSASGVLDAGVEFDIYLLDILMPGLNGIELGRELRQSAPAAPLLYLTISREFALDAYSAEATGYLVKPIGRAEFFHAMDRAVDQCRRTRAGMIPVWTEDGVRGVFLHELLGVEAAGRTLDFHLLDEVVKTTGRKMSFGQLWEMLREDSRFLLVRRGCAVNMDLIVFMGDTDLELADGCRIPIPRDHRAQARRTYLDHCRRRFGEGAKAR